MYHKVILGVDFCTSSGAEISVAIYFAHAQVIKLSLYVYKVPCFFDDQVLLLNRHFLHHLAWHIAMAFCLCAAAQLYFAAMHSGRL